MADVDKTTGQVLTDIGIVERSNIAKGKSPLRLRVQAHCDMNLPAVDRFIGELITWRDRLAVMIEREKENQ